MRLARGLEGLASGGVNPIVIKGAHLAQTIYASPALRPRGDTDLVIAEEEQASTASILQRAGYRRRVHVRGTLILGLSRFYRATCRFEPGYSRERVCERRSVSVFS